MARVGQGKKRIQSFLRSQEYEIHRPGRILPVQGLEPEGSFLTMDTVQAEKSQYMLPYPEFLIRSGLSGIQGTQVHGFRNHLHGSVPEIRIYPKGGSRSPQDNQQAQDRRQSIWPGTIYPEQIPGYSYHDQILDQG